jgi:hypothetical protein
VDRGAKAISNYRFRHCYDARAQAGHEYKHGFLVDSRCHQGRAKSGPKKVSSGLGFVLAMIL